MNLLTQEYELKNNREQFLYQKQQDALSQSNWEKEFAYQQNRDDIADKQFQQTFDYNKSVDDRNYNYQINRDAVADSQWQREYDLSKKKASSGSSSKKSTGSYKVKDDGNPPSGDTKSKDPLIAGALASVMAGANPQATLANSLVAKVQKGEMSEQEANKIINSLRW